jgi:hypothetical protein
MEDRLERIRDVESMERRRDQVKKELKELEEKKDGLDV